MSDFLDKVLPDECVCAIWALLHPEDLRAVMRVSSAWAHSAASVLYRDIRISEPASLQCLLRTVQDRPDWAAHVRRLSLHEPVSDTDRPQSLAGSAPTLLQHLPALQKLCLEGGWRGGVDHLLEHVPVLKSLQYDHWCDVNDKRSLQDCDELNRGMHCFSHTLEHLDVRVQLYSADAEEVLDLLIDPVNGHLSLSRFTNLRTLRIPVTMLLGWTPQDASEIGQLLPSSLRNLCLTEDLAKQYTYRSEDVLLEKLHTFFTTLDHSNHALELVEFYPVQMWGRWEDVMTQRLQDMAMEAGVRCFVFEYEPDDA